MAEQEIILEAQGLTKEFKGFVAVKNVNLRSAPYHPCADGPNGAGKTTCFNLLTHFLTPTAGRIRVQRPRHHRFLACGNRAHGAGAARSRSRRCFPISRCARTCGSRCSASCGNSFFFWRSERVLDELNARALELVEAVGLTAFAEQQAVDLPYGRKRALEIATTLALDPEMMLLDEPMAGLGQEDIKRIAALIRTVAKDRTVLMVEHNMSVVADLSDTITVLARGEVLAEGPYATVSQESAGRRSLCRDGPWLTPS